MVALVAQHSVSENQIHNFCMYYNQQTNVRFFAINPYPAATIILIIVIEKSGYYKKCIIFALLSVG